MLSVKLAEKYGIPRIRQSEFITRITIRATLLVNPSSPIAS
jgi:hypothetical protein